MKNISKEDYLSTIYKLRDEEGEVKANQIAETLEISNAAVTDMLRKLSRDGFVEYEKYKSIKLSGDGEVYAINMVRRHRIWETFLHQVLKLPWDKVHGEAEMLEHSSSDELINKLDEFLNYPDFDPHGYPIPKKNGKFPKQKKSLSLSELNAKEKGTVLMVNDYNSGFLTHISKIGIELEKEIEVINKLEFDGSLIIKIDGKEFNISKKIASNIFVNKL